MFTLADFGSFHVGGRRVTVADQPSRPIYFTPTAPHNHDPNGNYHIEQAYVQYFIPQEQVFPFPVVLVHGGGMSGVTWETTPDGRPGWLQNFVSAGFAVYIIDNVERGRAGWCALPGQWQGEPLMRTEQEAWNLFRFGKDKDFAVRRAFSGLRFPIACLPDFMRQFVPRWTSTGAAAKAALATLIDRIGPCVLICHSQGSDPAFACAFERSDKVLAVVGLEPSGIPAAVPHAGVQDKPWLLLFGDYLDASAIWRQLLPRVRRLSEQLAAAQARVQYTELTSAGIHGNSHMLMMDDNNDVLARRVQDWLLSQI